MDTEEQLVLIFSGTICISLSLKSLLFLIILKKQ